VIALESVKIDGSVLSLLPKRKQDAHKGNFGRVLLLCGSVGYTGAAAMAAMAAARCGSGLVYLGVPQSVYPILAAKLDVPMVFPLPDDGGMFSSAAVTEILKRLPQMDAVLIGPGIGQSDGTHSCVRAVLENARCPVVVDADGINVLRHHIDILRESTCPVIVTPHPGEFVRLGGSAVLPREEAAKKLSQELNCICVLKGSGTVVTDGTAVFVNTTGNPGMAVGGSGDVLAGMLTSFVGQGVSPLEAAKLAVYLHGKAGDLCAETLGQYAMLPTDMIDTLCRLLP